STQPGLVEALIARAERELAEARPRFDSTLRWLAGAPLLRPIRGEADAPPMAALTWAYRGEMEELILKEGEARRLREAILELGGSPGGRRLEAFSAAAFTEPAGDAATSALVRLLGSGLVAT
ncbi:MAG: hypothetical protein M0Z80_09800, partial [Treponema sp.]|nr:hypothetical protein [Treponema sp.]